MNNVIGKVNATRLFVAFRLRNTDSN